MEEAEEAARESSAAGVSVSVQSVTRSVRWMV